MAVGKRHDLRARLRERARRRSCGRSRPTTRRRNWRRHRPEHRLRPARQARRRRTTTTTSRSTASVEVELNPKAKQSDLVAALEPVADRLLKRYKAAQARWQVAPGAAGREGREGGQGRDGRADPVQAGHGRIPARLHLPVADLRLRQHGDREARSIFYRRLLPLLEFGREREGSICRR